jgi:hypothetical protein
MPSHGEPVDFTKIKLGKTGYLGSTIHRGTILVSPAQKKLLMARGLPHTNVYRSASGNVYRKRLFSK